MIIKISKNTLWLSAIGILIIGIVLITIISNPGKEVSKSESSLSSNADSININSLGSTDNSISSRQQSAEMGAVTVDVEPKLIGKPGENNIFFVSFNTHSVELDFDFTEIISLEDDRGNTYNATEWTGNSGWHHVSGDIIFPSINDNATKITMQINKIENKTQSFEWDID